ncbi:hypothetical protein [Halopenitus malekzadehii]|uniref:hypothetical protein n=1 Tax=Halopenitus malekzadehii TaxID=1267564 RepID=UPI0015A57605|nr:hypothetical protein [Halopenitus malekzadehii]
MTIIDADAGSGGDGICPVVRTIEPAASTGPAMGRDRFGSRPEHVREQRLPGGEITDRR